jgi:ArsR family transcriptional regulator, arsenate/arsenite/antimonite-responsive transcriptional repressor
VCDLVAALDVAQPSISRHLAYLRAANLIWARKEGLWSYYRLRDAATPLQVMVLGSLEAVASELPEAKTDAKRLRECQSGCCE